MVMIRYKKLDLAKWARWPQRGGIILNRKCTIIFLVLLMGLLSGCSAVGETETKPDMEGIVLEIDEAGMTLARGLSPEEYEEIKNESITKLHKEYVAGKRDDLRLIDLIYEGETELEKGDELEVWLDGDIMEVFPERARAKKILLKQ